MLLSEFDFTLPEALIARYPLAERTDSRLLCVHKHSGDIVHRHFYDVLDLLHPGDVLVLNNTRVIPARLLGQKHSGGKVEFLIERILTPTSALVHMRASKAAKVGTEVLFAHNVVATLKARQETLWECEFNGDILTILEAQGEIPLPPYFARSPEESDKARYQTVFATENGAVAAPTAGLHFTETLLAALKEKGVHIVYVTLHVGAGTFQPIRVEDYTTHQMHYEWMKIEKEACDRINQAKAQGKRVIAVGTTSVRTLETAAKASPEELAPFAGNTNLFIYPGYRYQVVDAMITNFHLPKTSLLLLVSAFASQAIILNAYQQAIEAKYRFFSYGDAMFISG